LDHSASTRLVEAAEEYGMVHPPSMKVQRKRGTQRMKHIRKLLDLADNLNQVEPFRPTTLSSDISVVINPYFVYPF
jgi:hypothetical protein